MSLIHIMHLGVPILSPQKLKVGKKLNIVRLTLTTFSGCAAIFFFCDVIAKCVTAKQTVCLRNNVRTH